MKFLLAKRRYESIALRVPRKYERVVADSRLSINKEVYMSSQTFLMEQLEGLGLDVYVPKTSTWKYAFVASNRRCSLYVLVRKRGIDFKLYDEPNVLMLDKLGKLSTAGGLILRCNYQSANQNLHEFTLNLVSEFLESNSIEKYFLEAHAAKFFNKYTFASEFANNMALSSNQDIRVRRNKSGFNVYYPPNYESDAQYLLVRMGMNLGGRPITTGIFGATLIQLLSGTTANNIEPLVLDAIRRSNNSLSDASVSEIGDYLTELSPEQLQGVINNVKGIYHELAFVENESNDGDEWTATFFDNTNHAGSDVVLYNNITGEIQSLQLKATDSEELITSHVERYPEIGIAVTDELAASMDVESSGFSNTELATETGNTIECISLGDEVGSDLLSESIFDIAVPGIGIAAALAGAQASSEKASGKQVRKEVTKAVVRSAPISIVFGLLFGIF